MFKYPEIDSVKTGNNIRQLCKEKNLSVYELQRLLYVGSNQAIYNWFNGKSIPSVETFYALATLLDVTMDDLIVLK